jgi:hypothetical protein
MVNLMLLSQDYISNARFLYAKALAKKEIGIAI